MANHVDYMVLCLVRSALDMPYVIRDKRSSLFFDRDLTWRKESAFIEDINKATVYSFRGAATSSMRNQRLEEEHMEIVPIEYRIIVNE
jgi:hypothetical protein